MANPQQPELARSRKTPSQDQDSVAAVVEGQRATTSGGDAGPIPADNEPGHHPDQEQDKADLDAFAEKLGLAGSGGASERADAADDTDDTDGPGDLSGSREIPLVRKSGEAQGRRRVQRRMISVGAGAGAVLVSGLVVGRRRRRSARS